MRKIIVLIFVIGLGSGQAFAFWIWSPKTGKWKNPKYSPRPSPVLQFNYAREVFGKGDYKRAYKEFRKVIIYFPGSKEASEAQYYMGRCLEEMHKDYEAFLAYKKLIESYPFSDRIEESVKRQYQIGLRLLDKYPKKILGMKIEIVEHPSVDIFKTIVDEAPYSKYAPLSLYKMGFILKKLSRYQEAEEAFQKLIDNYPESEWVQAGRYQLALCKIEKNPGVDYDHSELEEARKTFEEFVKNHPEAKISHDAQKQLSLLREKEAKKYLKIAQFYESQKSYDSARLYYRYVIDNFPQTNSAQEANKKLKEMP